MEMEMKKININILDESEIEQRVIALIRAKPKGISDKALSNEMPDLKPHRRGEIINKLVSQGHVELLKQAGLLVYRFKDSTKLVKGSTNEEKMVFKIIEEVGNKGIWIGDIRKKTNLMPSQLRTILKNFEDERLIKVKTSVTSNKKMHMLYHLEPDVSITGSVWYQDNEIETEFIDVLSQQCYQFLEQKRENMEILNSGPIAARNAMSASSEEIWKFISDLGISKVKLSIKEIEMILKTLIYDGKIEQIPSGDDKNLYKSIRPLVNLSGLIGNPCGLCPVRKKCSDEGTFTSLSCQYLREWLEQ
ncbi:DNA-directed RNA polymerase III subunit RPC6-like [Temnothorax longispinosus]|uniref:DNA-directed RNA polymerase III subunit RPC6-like n=1 Tax=Temnothorax longispinosus TaxID=300112 RepID=UPI003A9972F2